MTEAEAVRSHDGLVRKVAGEMQQRYPGYRRISKSDLYQSGRAALVIALREYDPSLGIKFSTFAGKKIAWAISGDYGLRWFRDPVEHAYPIWDAIDEVDLFAAIADREEAEWIAGRVRLALGQIDRRRAFAVGLRYGIGVDGTNTLEVVSRALGVTKERGRQIVERGCRDLANSPIFFAEREARKADKEARERRKYEDMIRRRAMAQKTGMRLAGGAR